MKNLNDTQQLYAGKYHSPSFMKNGQDRGKTGSQRLGGWNDNSAINLGLH